MQPQKHMCQACGRRAAAAAAADAINASATKHRPSIPSTSSSTQRLFHHPLPFSITPAAQPHSRTRQQRLSASSSSSSSSLHPSNPTRRRYHSYDRPTPPPFPPAETAILTAALQHVPQHGFSTTALTLGARSAGYLDISKNLFPRGVFDLVNFHLVTRRLALKYDVQFPEREGGGKGQGEDYSKGQGQGKGGGSGSGNGKGQLSVEEKVRALMMGRLRANGEVLGRWHEALRIMAQPRHVSTSLAELGRLADEILFLAGDTTVDTGWYTKRAALSAVYSATEIYMATVDTSEGYADTERFLDKRLDRARTVGYAMGSLGEWAGFSALSAVNVLRSKGVRI